MALFPGERLTTPPSGTGKLRYAAPLRKSVPVIRLHVMAPCSLIGRNQRLRATYCFLLQGGYATFVLESPDV